MFGLFKRRKKTKTIEEPKQKDLGKVNDEVVSDLPTDDDLVEDNEQVSEENTEDFESSEQIDDGEEPNDDTSVSQKKSRKPINHITKHKDGGWKIKKEGAQRALKRFSTQKEAIEFAKELEKTTGTAFIIHKANGATRKKTYK
jgi:hypothetical protein